MFFFLCNNAYSLPCNVEATTSSIDATVIPLTQVKPAELLRQLVKNRLKKEVDLNNIADPVQTLKKLVNKQQLSNTEKDLLVKLLTSDESYRSYLSKKEQESTLFLLEDKNTQHQKEYIESVYYLTNIDRNFLNKKMQILINHENDEIAKAAFKNLIFWSTEKIHVLKMERLISVLTASDAHAMAEVLLTPDRLILNDITFPQFKSKLSSRYYTSLKENKDDNAKYWAALILMYFNYENIDLFSLIVPLLENQEDTHLQYYYDYLDVLYTWTDNDTPTWIFKGSDVAFGYEMPQKELIAHSLIKYYPQKSMGFLYDYLTTTCIPHKEKNRILQSVTNHASKYIDFQKIEQIYEGSPVSMKLELLALLYQAKSNGVNWDSKNNVELLKYSNAKELNVRNRALIIAKGVSSNIDKGKLPELPKQLPMPLWD